MYVCDYIKIYKDLNKYIYCFLHKEKINITNTCIKHIVYICVFFAAARSTSVLWNQQRKQRPGELHERPVALAAAVTLPASAAGALRV